jgi:hypothetical protein
MTRRGNLKSFALFYGGNVKYTVKLQVLGALALLSAGLFVAGCSSAPPLDKAAAQSLIQAKLDSTPATGIDIIVTDLGMGEGVTAGYWVGKGRYPNGYWADFTVTPAGKKLFKLASGSDTIQWRPDSPSDKSANITITTLTANHPKARDLSDIQTVGDTRTVDFTEALVYDGIPDALQGIAHNPPNKPATVRHASFSLANGAWQLTSIQ